MGRVVLEVLTAEEDIRVRHAVDQSGLSGQRIQEYVLESDANPAELKSDVWIDISLPSPATKHAKQAESLGIPILIGTTGFSDSEMTILSSLSNAHIIAPNLSIAVNLLFGTVGAMRRTLGAGFDTAIVETHHRHKVDAPSGTASRLREVLENAVDDNQYGPIQISSLRIGEVTGEHRVLFASEGEEIEVIHRARSRMAFARGVPPAVRFLSGKTGGAYTMADVLGI